MAEAQPGGPRSCDHRAVPVCYANSSKIAGWRRISPGLNRFDRDVEMPGEHSLREIQRFTEMNDLAFIECFRRERQSAGSEVASLARIRVQPQMDSDEHG